MVNPPKTRTRSSAIPIKGIDEFRARRARCERSLRYFAKQAWHVVEPVTPLMWGLHMDAVCDHLEAVTRGQIQNLIINIPPGHAKSLLTGVFWPAWEWILSPHQRWLFASYSGTLSVRDSVKCRRLIQSQWYQRRWSKNFSLCDDQNAKLKFENNKTGYRIATSVGGTGTGERASRVVSDDPHNVVDRESDSMREAVIQWWDEAFSNRVADSRNDARVIIHQRLHEKDLTGHLLARADHGYEHLCLPTEYDPARRSVTKIWQDWRTKEGELLFPARFGPKQVAEAKMTLGPTGYAGQHMQLPNPAGGNRFKSSYFRYWTDHGEFYKLIGGGMEKIVVKSDCWVFAAMDPAGSEKGVQDKACYTVIQVWAVTLQADMLLLHQYREKVETPEVANAGADICRRYNTLFMAVEKNGIGLGVVQNLNLTGIAIYPVTATTNKEARSETAEIRFAAGKVYFQQDAVYNFELENELMKFPNGEYADAVDCTSWAAIVVQQRHGAPTTEQPVATGYAPPMGQFKRTW